MTSRFSRELFIPSGSRRVADSESDAVVFMYHDEAGGPSAVAFHGQAQLPDWGDSFRNETARSNRIRLFFATRRLVLEQRRELVERTLRLRNPDKRAA